MPQKVMLRSGFGMFGRRGYNLSSRWQMHTYSIEWKSTGRSEGEIFASPS